MTEIHDHSGIPMHARDKGAQSPVADSTDRKAPQMSQPVTQATAPAATAASPADAAAPSGAPNQYHLHGSGISVSYIPDGMGPQIVGEGPVRFTYQDAHH